MMKGELEECNDDSGVTAAETECLTVDGRWENTLVLHGVFHQVRRAEVDPAPLGRPSFTKRLFVVFFL